MFSKMLILFNNYGPKKTDMPLDEAKKSVPPLKVLAAQTVQTERSRILDLQFLREITSDQPTPELRCVL